MATYARPVERLITELSKLPSIGPKSAQRIAFHIVRGPGEDAYGLAEALREVKDRIRPCKRCFNLTEEEECDICRDARRDASVICAVEDPYDIGSIEKTGEYRGLYHVLGGSLSPLDGVEPEDLRIAPETLRLQAQIAERVGRPQLAQNFRRAAELTALPDELVLSIYNSLRPRASTKEQLGEIADELESKYSATLCAQLVREAADVYERRDILAREDGR